MNAKDESVEGGAHLAADLIMGQAHPGMGLVARATAVMDRLALDAHQQISGVNRHWQIAIHLWPALKSVTHHTRQISGHLLAAGVDADMLAGLGPHPHDPRDPQRHLVFHTPIPTHQPVATQRPAGTRTRRAERPRTLRPRTGRPAIPRRGAIRS